MSYLVVKLDKQLNILEALELSTHGLATQKAHEFIDAGFCARITDKPVDPVAWFQEIKNYPPVRSGPKPDARGESEVASNVQLDTPPLTSRIRIKYGNNPGDLVRMPKPVAYEEFRGKESLSSKVILTLPQKRRVMIRHG
jgi:hypothetical protein